MLLLLLLSVSLCVNAADYLDLSNDNRKFTASLYKDAPTWNKDVDILLSPFSVQAVMAMTQSGAGGTTAEEIRTSVFLPATNEDTESAIKSALTTIDTRVSNKIYVENGFSNHERFTTTATDVYQSTFENVEFINSAAAATTVNDWAGEKTNKRFGAYFASNRDFNELSKDLLINSLYLKKNWSMQFDVSQTKTDTFTGEGNKKYTVSMMTQGPYFYNYYESEELNAKFLETPVGENATLTIFLPNEVLGLATAEKKIDMIFADQPYSKEAIQLSLPRMTIQATYLDLKGSLQRLGVTRAWNGEYADLSGMFGNPGELTAYNFIQDTYININEAEIEAAIGGMINIRVPTTKHFLVNRAFMFYIKVNGLVVMVGRVNQPVYTIRH